MIVIYPEERKKQMHIFKPYLEGCHLKKDTPKEIVDIYNDFNSWLRKVMEDNF